MLVTKLKSPKTVDFWACWVGAGGLEKIEGFEIFGLVSKKPPPLLAGGGDVIWGAARVERGWLKLEKGSGFGCCCGCDTWGEVGGLKFNPLNASFIPPKLD